MFPNFLTVFFLTKSLNCSVTFYPTHCVFQDLLTRKTIGGGHESDGLDYFDPHLRKAAASCASPNKESIFRWHCHLGHPSISSLRT